MRMDKGPLSLKVETVSCLPANDIPVDLTYDYPRLPHSGTAVMAAVLAGSDLTDWDHEPQPLHW